MSDIRFNVRRAALGAAAATALVVGAAPFALAQSADVNTDSVNTESISEGAGGEGSLNAGSLGSSDGSMEKLIPDTTTKACDLPNLGGSVKTIVPFLGLGIPTAILNLGTRALDEIPNPLETAGIDVHELGLGSLEGPLCSVIFGGTMTSIPTTTSAAATTTSEETSAESTTSSEATTTTEAGHTSATTTTSSQVPTASGNLGSIQLGSLGS